MDDFAQGQKAIADYKITASHCLSQNATIERLMRASA